MYQNQVRRASFKQNCAFFVQLNPNSVKTQKEKKHTKMIEKRFFLSNLLKTHFSFTFAISQNSKRALSVQNNPKKLKKIDVFKYCHRYGIYSKEILM